MNELAILVSLDGADPEEYFVYLSPYSEHQDGPETIAEYLNGSRRRFFPMVAASVSKMINRDQILWVRYAKLPDPVEPEVTPIRRVTILELADGSRIEGSIPIGDRPKEQSRISDVLNDPGEIFLRIDDQEQTYYVNKWFIRRVILNERTPRRGDAASQADFPERRAQPQPPASRANRPL